MAEIRNHNGRPAIYIDGKFYPPQMATIRNLHEDTLYFDSDYHRALGEAGVKIYFLICDTPWIKPNAIELFKKEAEALLAAVPDAYIVARIGLHPSNEWIEAHPEECLTFSDGSSPETRLVTESYSTTMPHCYSLASSVWRRDAGEALRKTWEKLMALPYADRIIGCFPCAGGTSEWYYPRWPYDTEKKIAGDYSLAFRRNFTEYLTEKYGTDEALRHAWGNPEATLENPPIPSWEKHYFIRGIDADCAAPAKRLLANDTWRADVRAMSPNGCPATIGAIVDLDNHADIYDFYRAWHYGTAKSVLHFAKIIKDMTPDRLVGAFYGSLGCISYVNGGSSGGTRMIFDSGLVDFLAAPGVYENRAPGGFVGQREVTDSFALHNMIYIVEDDARTHRENEYMRNRYGMFDLTDSINVMKREFGRNLAEDTQSWWFDQLIGGNRYKQEELYELIRRQQEIAREAYSLDRTKNSEIALIVDEESLQVTSQQSTEDMLELFRNYEISKIGAPVDIYYHNDMSDPRMPDYKLYIFANTLILSDSEREVIKAKLRKNRATAIWVYASGLINPDRRPLLDKSNVEQLVGMSIELDEKLVPPRYRATDEGVKLGLEYRKIYGVFDKARAYCHNVGTPRESYMYPAFYPTGERTLASLAVNGKPAVAISNTDGYTSVFHASKVLSAEFVRAIARTAGVHVYSDEEDTLFVSKSYITVHAARGGKKHLSFPDSCTLTEVYENKVYLKDGKCAEFDMYIGETKTFRIE